MRTFDYILLIAILLALGSIIWLIFQHQANKRKDKNIDNILNNTSGSLSSLLTFLSTWSGIHNIDFVSQGKSDKNKPTRNAFIVSEEEYKEFEKQKAEILAAQEALQQAYELGNKALKVMVEPGTDRVKPFKLS